MCLASAAATPPGELLGLHDPAVQHRTTGLEPLSHDVQAKWPDTLSCGLARKGRYDRKLVGVNPSLKDPAAPSAEELADHDAAAMKRLFTRPMPDWSDRAAVAEYAAESAGILGDDPTAARATAERKWDRSPNTEPAVQMANQLGTVFAALDCKPRWRERLPQLVVPTLVVHGRHDRFFPFGNGEALAREIPGARLLVLEQAATAIPDAAVEEVATAMLAL